MYSGTCAVSYDLEIGAQSSGKNVTLMAAYCAAVFQDFYSGGGGKECDGDVGSLEMAGQFFFDKALSLVWATLACAV
jgi:hypothetical protein